MRNLILKTLVIFSIPFLVCCNKSESDNGTKNYGKNLKLLKTTLGGCNIHEVELLKSASEALSDSFDIDVTSESLKIYLGLEYGCGIGFDNKCTISYDSLLITLTDTCTQHCDSWCDCYYTWNFDVWKGELDSCYYKVVLNIPRLNESHTLREGKIKL
jgi:hypothetical protein